MIRGNKVMSRRKERNRIRENIREISFHTKMIMPFGNAVKLEDRSGKTGWVSDFVHKK